MYLNMMNLALKMQTILWLGALYRIQVNAELFTSTANMEKLLDVEDVFITNLKSYIATQEVKMKMLKDGFSYFERNHRYARADPYTYLTNPINAFLLTKRLLIDWEPMEKELATNTSQEILQNITEHLRNVQLPTDEDLIGVGVALTQLQEIHNLKTEDIRKGILNGVNYGFELTPSDWYFLGNHSFVHGMHNSSILWFNETLNSYKDDTSEAAKSIRYDILGSMAISYYHQEMYQEALDVTKELVKLFPEDETGLENLELIETDIGALTNNPDKIPLSEKTVHDADPFIVDDYQKDRFKKLCRKEIGIKPPLQCKYATNKQPFLTIAPLKVEEVWLDPYIIIYHDVLYDHEIAVLKELAEPKLHKNFDDLNKTHQADKTKLDFSKYTRINTDEHQIIKNINNRVEDMTGFSVATAEPLQVLNYGIGGVRLPQFDFALRSDFTNDLPENGNRIATVLFFMTDVDKGGETVFPLLDLSVNPEKGSGLFWLNLYVTGEGDFRTKYGMCPVLSGNKWVANKWLQINGQEFVQPCDMFDYDDY